MGRGWGCRAVHNTYVGTDVFLERPASQRVELNSSARLNCTANDSTLASVQWRRGDSAVVVLSGRVTVEEGSLLLASVTWSDIGEYTCVITFNGAEYSASAVLNISGIWYIALRLELL